VTKKPKPEPVSIKAVIRKAYTWFEELAAKIDEKCITKRRKEEALAGAQLTPAQLQAELDELERIQKLLNPLLVERENHLKKIWPHWGHTGVDEMTHPAGKSLIVTSLSYKCGDPDKLQAAIPESQWLRVSKRTLDPKLAMAEADKDEEFRKTLMANVIGTVKTSFYSPSSRRPKSGQPTDEEDEE